MGAHQGKETKGQEDKQAKGQGDKGTFLQTLGTGQRNDLFFLPVSLPPDSLVQIGLLFPYPGALLQSLLLLTIHSPHPIVPPADQANSIH